MAFHKSSKHIDVISGSLKATCKDIAGRDCQSELNLDAHLGNKNGFFEWGGRGFSQSARDVKTETEGEQLFICAQLKTQHKSWRYARVNISDRITNHNGKLKYIGGNIRQVEHSRDFLGEERDLFSAAISDTISDLTQLFTGSSIFNPPAPRSQQRESAGVHSEMREVPSLIKLEESTVDTTKSTADTDEKKINHVSIQPLLEELDETAQEHENNIMQQIKDFLLSGNGRSVRSSMSRDGARDFHLLDADGSEVKALSMEDRTLFDQDNYRRGSLSEASDHGRPNARCMTPSVVDGESEYDFLD